MTDMLDLVGHLRTELGALADTIADQIIENVWRPLSAADRADDVEALLRRGRLLLLQGVVSLLADRLGAAFARQAADAPNSAELRAVIDHIRIGAIADANGNVTSWSNT